MIKYYIFLTLALLFVSPAIIAQDFLPNRFSLSLNASAYQYDEVYKFDRKDFSPRQYYYSDGEYDEGDEIPLMEMKGMFVGVEMQYKHYIKQKVMISPSLHYRYGMLEYFSDFSERMSIWKVDGEFAGIKNNMVQLEIESGCVFNFSSGFFTPKVGLGFRFLHDNQVDADTIPATSLPFNLIKYNSVSRYLFVPIGGEFSYVLGEKNAISASVRYNYLVCGKQTTINQGIQEGASESLYYDLHKIQKKGHGINSSISYDHTNSSNKILFVKFFIEMWSIDESDYAHSTTEKYYDKEFIEHKNKTVNAGLGIGVKF